jgi:hypothetical protein
MASALARRVPLTLQVYACFTRPARGRVASARAGVGEPTRRAIALFSPVLCGFLPPSLPHSA